VAWFRRQFHPALPRTRNRTLGYVLANSQRCLHHLKEGRARTRECSLRYAVGCPPQGSRLLFCSSCVTASIRRSTGHGATVLTPVSVRGLIQGSWKLGDGISISAVSSVRVSCSLTPLSVYVLVVWSLGTVTTCPWHRPVVSFGCQKYWGDMSVESFVFVVTRFRLLFQTGESVSLLVC